MSNRPNTLGPSEGEERILSLDIIRGFTLVMLAFANLFASFRGPSVPEAFYAVPWKDGMNMGVEHFVEWVIAGKTTAIFFILFGFGLTMQFEKAQQKGDSFWAFGTRRMLVLFCIGIFHAFFLWSGDIVHMYGMVGLLLMAFLPMKTRNLLICSAIAAALSVLPKWLASFGTVGSNAGGLIASDQLYRETLTSEFQKFGQTDYWPLVMWRIKEFLNFSVRGGMVLVLSIKIVAHFLLGAAIFKARILQEPERHLKMLRWVRNIALPGGFILGVLNSYRDQLDHVFPPMIAKPLHMLALVGRELSKTGMAVGYGTWLILLVRDPKWLARLSTIAPAGRMLLTNYLMHSLIYGFVFYHYGLGLFAKMSPTKCALLAMAVLAVQFPLSWLWLKKFKFGPVEWFWRCLSYGKWSSMVIRKPVGRSVPVV
jgi:uncharacterized protein